jgi:hypothetical protein
MFRQVSRVTIILMVVLASLCPPVTRAESKVAGEPAISDADIKAFLHPNIDVDGLRARGRAVLPGLARLYERSDPAGRAVIAYAFYQLGWESPDAKRVLMRDVRTRDKNLRLWVQWALGRVSGDPDVVDALVTNMQHDLSPLFRNKAACALASDQIHLSERERADLLERLIGALRDPKIQVRVIALQVLRTHTGQTKGFNPGGTPAEREAVIQKWEAWLEEYRSQL